MRAKFGTVAAALVAVSLFAAPGSTYAMGGGGDSPAAAPAKSPYDRAVAKVKAKDYRGAIPLLKQVVAADRRNVDAFNYLGYSYRETGDLQNALINYQTALSIDPNHKGANEYLGELYVRIGDLAKAKEQLAKLDRLCSFGCTEYEELKRKVAALSKKQGS